MTYSAADINAALDAGLTVTAIAADLPRKGQPTRGTEVRVERAVSDRSDGRVSVRAVGYRNAFAVRDVAINGETAADLRAEARR